MAETTLNHGNTPTNRTLDGGSDGTLNPTKTPQYVAFVLVPTFFVLGLLGILICHILKKRGYNCTTESEEEECLEDEKDPEAADQDTFSDGNNDTVNQIVHYIMKNEGSLKPQANSDALRAMVHENSVDSDGPSTPTSPTTPYSPSPPPTPLSPGAPVGAAKHTCSHLHTIAGVDGHKNICGRCSQKKWPIMRQSSKSRVERRSLHGEVTVLSVGRFRVTKCDPKTVKERRTLIITETNGGMPHSPVEKEPRSRMTSVREEENDSAK